MKKVLEIFMLELNKLLILTVETFYNTNLLIIVEMRYRNWRLPKSKQHSYKNKKAKQKHKDEMKSAKTDDKELKRKYLFS